MITIKFIDKIFNKKQFCCCCCCCCCCCWRGRNSLKKGRRAVFADEVVVVVVVVAAVIVVATVAAVATVVAVVDVVAQERPVGAETGAPGGLRPGRGSGGVGGRQPRVTVCGTVKDKKETVQALNIFCDIKLNIGLSDWRQLKKTLVICFNLVQFPTDPFLEKAKRNAITGVEAEIRSSRE